MRRARRVVAFRIPFGLYERLQAEAVDRGQSLTAIVTEKLSRDVLLTEIRTIIREELGK